MFRSWQNSLQNLNSINEVATFFIELKVQSKQFKNKLNNRDKYLKKLNAVYDKEDETLVKKLQNLEKSNAEISKALKVYQRNVKSKNTLKQNNEAIVQIYQMLEENAERRKLNLKELYNLKKFKVEFFEKTVRIFLHAARIRVNLQQQQRTDLQQGLCSDVIEKFPLFTADESHVGDQCSICMEDFEIGRNMMRLDCDGKHAFCQVCIEGWFADHNTCPLCRHMFI